VTPEGGSRGRRRGLNEARAASGRRGTNRQGRRTAGGDAPRGAGGAPGSPWARAAGRVTPSRWRRARLVPAKRVHTVLVRGRLVLASRARGAPILPIPRSSPETHVLFIRGNSREIPYLLPVRHGNPLSCWQAPRRCPADVDVPRRACGGFAASSDAPHPSDLDQARDQMHHRPLSARHNAPVIGQNAKQAKPAPRAAEGRPANGEAPSRLVSPSAADPPRKSGRNPQTRPRRPPPPSSRGAVQKEGPANNGLP